MAFTNAEHQKRWREKQKRERDTRAEADAEEYIGTLSGVEQTIAIQRLVRLGAWRFIGQIAQGQRRERLRALRKASAPELGPIAARVQAMRAAREK